MSKFQDVVDLLSSMAALIAIISVMVSWFRSKQKPLKIERVVLHRKESECNYILVVKNRKDFPVVIKSINAYTTPKFRIEQQYGNKPMYSEVLSLSDSLFLNSDSTEIGARGHEHVKVVGNHFTGNLSRILFSIQTSHGYHEIWCKKILTVEMDGKTTVIALKHLYESNQKVKALSKYYWLLLINKFK